MSNCEVQTKMFIEAGEASAYVQKFLDTTSEKFEKLIAEIIKFDPNFVVTCARGSSDHAATYAKYMIEKSLGLAVVSHAPSMSSVYARPLKLDKALFITISQSGGSPDLIKSAKLAREQGALTVAFCNVTLSPLAEVCEYVIPLCAGPENSVAATKSYILSLVAIANLVGKLTQDNELNKAIKTLPEKLAQAWNLDWSNATPVLKNAHNFFVVSRGLGLGIAQEAALKFKETSGLHAEAYSSAEVRHGPMALIKKDFPILLFVPNDASTDSFDKIAKDFIDRGAKVISAGKAYEGGITLPTVQSVHPSLSVICMIQSFYKMINSLALARGYDPDSPPFLKKVTETI